MDQFRSLGAISKVLGNIGPLHERIRARLVAVKNGKVEVGKASLETWANEAEVMARRIVELENRLGAMALERLEAKK